MTRCDRTGFAIMLLLALTTAAQASGQDTAAPTHGSAPEGHGAAPLAIDPLPVQPHRPLTDRVRAMRLVQDRIADGNGVAIDAQRAVLDTMLDLMERTPPSLENEEDRLALAVALFNGLPPDEARGAGLTPDILAADRFLDGALAYAEGRLGSAREALNAVDPATLPVEARAQYHLTLGSLLIQAEPAQAIRHFGAVRLMAPGTLMEEAALRREAMLSLTDVDGFLQLVTSYLQRFGQSPLASGSNRIGWPANSGAAARKENARMRLPPAVRAARRHSIEAVSGPCTTSPG